jgi:hydroxymethylbilane synthase
LVAKALREREPGLEVEVVPIKTSGDRGLGGDDRGRGGDGGDKARFVKEIEEALLRRDVDLAVHSAKDVPSELPEGLAILGVPARADARDALCGAGSLDDLDEGARVGTASLRRRAQLLVVRPDFRVEDLRGNVDTRLRRLEEGEFDAVVLAAAGLQRLGRSDAGAPVDASVMTPASGQGALVLQGRLGDEGVVERCAALSDDRSFDQLRCERALVAALDASCRTPLGAHAVHDDGSLRLDVFAGLPDGSWWIRDTLGGPAADPEGLGRTLADRLLSAGAGDLLRALS